MRLLIFFLLLFFCIPSNSQVIMISGKETTRLLTWNDFTGKPDPTSPFHAVTKWKISSRFKGQGSNTSGLKGVFQVVLSLDQQNSWRKRERESDHLLAHEQGHFNIGILCMRDLVKQLNALNLDTENAQSAIAAIFNVTIKKYQEMDDLYDKETEHSMNEKQQERWNAFFIRSLK